MTEFVSEVKTIPFNEDRIFNMLSDLSNLEKVQDRIPEDKIKDFEFDKDSCSFSVAPVGKITFQIVEREPNKTIKFTTTNSPVHLFQLNPEEQGNRRVRSWMKKKSVCLPLLVSGKRPWLIAWALITMRLVCA